jgi:hypothetical protein
VDDRAFGMGDGSRLYNLFVERAQHDAACIRKFLAIIIDNDLFQ